MRVTRWWWGMLCVAGMACADEPVVGARPDEARVSGDLEFVLPAVRDMPGVLRGSDAVSPAADLAEESGDATAIRETTSAPLIFTTSVAVAFAEKQLRYQYGMTGFGSGYTMTPTLNIMTSEGDTPSVSAGPGRSEDLFFAWRFRPTVSGHAELSRDCGMSATLHVLFEARMAGRIVNTSREQKPDQASAYAPPCPPQPTTGSGTRSGAPIYYLTVCSYELWVDLDGNVIDVIFLGCSTVALPQMA